MGKTETLDTLFLILNHKVYAIDPSLIRNDSKAAKRVVALVDDVSERVELVHQKRWDLQSNYDRQMALLHESTSLLEGLTLDTIRKYIAELWKAEKFNRSIRFVYVDEIARRDAEFRELLDRLSIE